MRTLKPAVMFIYIFTGIRLLVGVNIGSPNKWMKEIKCTGGMFYHSVFV